MIYEPSSFKKLSSAIIGDRLFSGLLRRLVLVVSIIIGGHLDRIIDIATGCLAFALRGIFFPFPRAFL
jgi:hypothetical protein